MTPEIYKNKLNELFHKVNKCSLTAFVLRNAALSERGMSLHGDVRLIELRSHLQS